MSNESAIYSRGRTYYVAGVGILFDHGTTVPTDGLADYAPGCLFQKTDGGADACLYVNQGTLASCNFDPLDIGALLATNIPVVDTADYFAATNVETVLAEIRATLALATTPGGASLVGVFDTAGYWTAATVEAALAELGALRYGNNGTAGGRGPSPLIWANCPVMDYILNPTLGSHYFNDFQDVAVALAAAQTATLLDQGIMGFTAATGATIAQPVDEPNGVIKLLGTTDDMDNGIAILGGKNVAGNIVFTSGKKLWFEARVKMLNVDNTTAGVFCGFAEEALGATTILITAAGALPDKDYVGFHRLEADGDMFDTVHRKSAGAAVSVKTDAVTLVADTYKKVGIYCDGTTVKFYADGVLLADTALLETATFPTGEELAFYFVQMLAATAAFSSNIDWVRVAREY